AGKHALAFRSRTHVQRVLQPTGQRPVVFRSHEQHGGRVPQLLTKPRPARRRSAAVQVLVVERQVADLEDAAFEAGRCLRDQRIRQLPAERFLAQAPHQHCNQTPVAHGNLHSPSEQGKRAPGFVVPAGSGLPLPHQESRGSHRMNTTVDTPAAAGPPGHELSRSLRSRHIQMISIGGIIGAGLFVGSSAAIAAAGPAILLSYLLAGLMILMVMRMLSEMAAATPGLGSFTEYVRLGLGHWGGFVSGWLYWYFWVLVVAIEAIAGAKILSAWIALPVWQIVALLMALLTAVNLMSSRSYGEFEFWFSSIKVAAIVIFIMIGGAYAL